MALGLEEGVGHAAADEDAVGLAEELVDDGELVGDLGAAERDDVGPLDVLGELLQDADLGGDQEAGGVRQARRELVDGGVPTVHRAEAVADVDVRQGGEPVGELAALGVVLGGLARVEAQVLDDGDLTVAQARDRRPRGLADRVGRERHGGAEEFTESGGGGGERERRVRRALGTAQVRGDDHLGAGLREGLDGGQHGADPAVVGDCCGAGGLAAGCERHVEVGADEDPLACDAFGEKFVDRLHYGDSWGGLVVYVRQGSDGASLRRPSPALTSRCLI